MNDARLTLHAESAGWHGARPLWRDNRPQGRAAIGKRILATMSQQLTAEYGEVFTLRLLYRAIQFSQLFPDEGIVSALSTQLSWTRAPKGGDS